MQKKHAPCPLHTTTKLINNCQQTEGVIVVAVCVCVNVKSAQQAAVRGDSGGR